MLVVVIASAAAATTTASTAVSWRLQTALATIDAIRARTSAARPLDLLNDFYDPDSGLCSDGVWHNAWLGVSYVLASREVRPHNPSQAEELRAEAMKLGDTLYETKYAGGAFQRRCMSGFWQTASSSRDALQAAGEDVSFYEASSERRCVSNAAATIFYSYLAEEGVAGEASERFTQIADAFSAEFFDTSVCRFKRDADSTYWRAIDQAIGCLACLRTAKLGHRMPACRAMAASAADSLLKDYGYR
jgi:hypothetical protein